MLYNLLFIFCFSDYSNAPASDGSDILDDSDSEDIPTNVDGIFELYNNAPLTLNESMLCTLAFAVRHNLSGAAIADLLQLISIQLPKSNNMMKTLYFFKKYFSNLQAPVKLHYYCSECYSQLADDKTKCVNAANHKSKKIKVSFFLEIELEHQIKALFKRKNFSEDIFHRFQREKSGCIDDIYDGQLYKEFVESGFLSEENKFNISFTLNTDGVPVFKSSKTSMWPVFFAVNELPIKMRFKKNHMLLGGIWFGGKPLHNLMLEPFLNTFRTLKRGIQVELFESERKYLSRAILLAWTADLPAKADLMGIKHTSGSHSCLYCKIEGKSVKTGSVKITLSGKFFS